MKYSKQILLQDLKRQESIKEHYAPGQKESHTLNGKEQYKLASEKINDLREAISAIELKGQQVMF